ncbi:MAG: cytochrome c oxidase assembly protein [Acidimicrobiia bacterium]
MLNLLFAHVGRPLEPHDLLGSWQPGAGVLLAVVTVVYAWGLRTSPEDRHRDRCFFGGLGTLALALVSPLDALAGSLASAHMVQHMLILLVAAPLLARSRPSRVLLRVVPVSAMRTMWRWLRRLDLGPSRLDRWRRPVVLWLLYVGVMWFWHASGPYQAAVESVWMHGLEHATFLGAGLGFWWIALGLGRHPPIVGFRVLFVFAAGMQGVLLAALLTFSPGPWYPVYAATAAPFGLDPLTDQQLAGLVLWIPSGLIYIGAALSMVVRWVADDEGVRGGDSSSGLGSLEPTHRGR